MGFFDRKAICGCCGKECGLNRYKIKKSDVWLCPDCLKKAGGAMKVNVNKVTIEDIKRLIIENEQKQLEIINQKEKDLNDLSTAEGMYNYSVKNGFGSGMNEKWGIKHFKVIEENLLPDEDVLMSFIGLHNYEGTTKHDNNFAYVITNKRIIMGQKNTLSGEKLQTVYLNNLNDITFKSGAIFGVLTIDTSKEVFNVGLDKISAKAISSKVHEIINELKYSNNQENNVNVQQISSADEILKFKQLLDAGIITQEEFEAKKKQLLGI